MIAFASSAGPRDLSGKVAKLREAWGRARVAISPLLLAAAMGLGPGCASRSSTERVPVATLSTSRAAQDEFRALRVQFLATDRRDRVKLAPLLLRFVQQHPDDAAAQLASVYLAWAAIDGKDLPGAQEWLADIPRGPGGTTRDLAEMAEAAIIRRSGDPGRALERLESFVGKLIDPYARALFDEEIAGAAIGARRWYEAVAYLDLWLRDAQDQDVPAVRAQVELALATIPADALELMLQAMTSSSGGAGYGDQIKKVVTARLSTLALAQGDTKLARRLLEADPRAAPGDVEEGLAELASKGGAPRIDPRTVGLLLVNASVELRTQAADVLNGMMDGLDLLQPGDEKRAPFRLVTRSVEDPTHAQAELAQLASEGAGILVAGLSLADSAAAAHYAEQAKIPVLLLTDPGISLEGFGYTFLIGGSEGGDQAVLEAALAERGATRIARVGAVSAPPAGEWGRFVDSAPCSAVAERAGEPRFLPRWVAAKANALLLLGDGPCTGDALSEAPAVLRRRMALGLRGAHLVSEPLRAPVVAARAGRFPLLRGDRSSPMNAFRARHGSAPTWFAALGRDAAVLARSALIDPPVPAAERPAEVARGHELAASSLRRAEGDLWSTEARGFSGKQELARTIQAVEVP